MSARKTSNLPATARALRTWRRRRKLTQRELAARAGLTPAAVNAFERGEITPDQDDRERICTALDVVPGDFDREVFWIEKQEGFAGEASAPEKITAEELSESCRVSAPSITRPFLERYPEARYWLDLGFQPNVAKALVTAGYLNLADLAGKFREDLTAIRGFGSFSLAKCEALLGSPFPSRTEELAKSGIHPLVRNALERAGIRSLADLAKLTREQFLAIPGFGPKGLLQCERALGRPLRSSRKR